MPSMNTLDIPSCISDQVLGWYDGFNPIILFEVYGLSPNLPSMVGSWSPVMILVFEVHYFIHVRLRFSTSNYSCLSFMRPIHDLALCLFRCLFASPMSSLEPVFRNSYLIIAVVLSMCVLSGVHQPKPQWLRVDHLPAVLNQFLLRLCFRGD